MPKRKVNTADAEARLAAIVESSYDAIISKDLNSVVTSWNKAAERLFGYTAEEAVGHSILMLIPEHLRNEETEIISRIRSGERMPSFETIRRRKDGTVVPISITVSPIMDPSGQIVGASTIARDISATKENERRIRLLLREVNHRVKNQFAVILSMIRETRKRSISPETFERTVRERIMALSRSHDLLVSSEWNGAGLIDLVTEHLQPFDHEGQVTLTGKMLTLQPNAVQHLGMAFHELATNAVKYGALSSATGRIRIEWSVGKAATGQDEFRLEWDETLDPSGMADMDEARGFGTVVLEHVTPNALGGRATVERQRGRMHWELRAPLSSVSAAAHSVPEWTRA
ncbi:MAG: PAS domain S-box protein [Rhizobiaceae bacterium]|nr:PAS domain S-box protein [Rhizobiaceae bacterium]MCV0409082.1 PAS domain S-box protein [Rhizobiaceae bacterium]